MAQAYDQPVRKDWNRASYNGGPGGLRVAPTADEAQASRARHAPPTRAQAEQARAAGADPQLHARNNRGAPPIAGVSRPGAFHGPGAVVTGARSEANWTPPPRRQGGEQPGPAEDRGAGPEPGGPTAPRAETTPERGAPPARFAEPHAPAAERTGPGFARHEAAPEVHAPAAPRQSAPAFHAPPSRPEGRSEPAFHAAPAQPHPEPAAHAAAPEERKPH